MFKKPSNTVSDSASLLLYHAAQLVTPIGNTLKHGKEMGKLEIIPDAAVYIEGDTIMEVGQTDMLLKKYHPGKDGMESIDLTGKAIIPGFVDSHTHFVFGGYRPEEFIMRLSGAQYLDIMKMGGGIQSTVDATKKTPAETLFNDGFKRLNDMLSMGVTTVEGKSGYGLDRDCELKQLEVLNRLNREHPVDVEISYMGAHAIPRDYPGGSGAYIDFMVKEVLPLIQGKKLARFVDIFCEEGVFTPEESERYLCICKDLGFDTKIHADEIIPLGGGELAAKIGCASADHLLAVSDRGIQMLADSDTAATLLPCTAFCLNKPYAPARKLIDSGCAVALASDYNPGSCFTNSIPLIFSLGVIHMGMTIEEAICSLTLNGAGALKKADSIGSIEPGKKADITVLAYPDYRFLVYHSAKNIVSQVIKNGKVCYRVS
ncbi:imidazolonepropionase [Treponema primitia]|uniref:imidazolonepropionase n=1 Tax=Treponema primitia TaxID=88058 RepID=UPI0002554FA7|nr:imidazolonepropionase [Treponema primitia]